MKDETRRINCGVQKDVIVVADGDFICVYRTHDREKGVLCKAAPGVPTDYGEYFKLPKDTPDSKIVELVQMFEHGHKQGWIEGQHELRKEIQHLLGIWK